MILDRKMLIYRFLGVSLILSHIGNLFFTLFSYGQTQLTLQYLVLCLESLSALDKILFILCLTSGSLSLIQKKPKWYLMIGVGALSVFISVAKLVDLYGLPLAYVMSKYTYAISSLFVSLTFLFLSLYLQKASSSLPMEEADDEHSEDVALVHRLNFEGEIETEKPLLSPNRDQEAKGSSNAINP